MNIQWFQFNTVLTVIKLRLVTFLFRKMNLFCHIYDLGRQGDSASNKSYYEKLKENNLVMNNFWMHDVALGVVHTGRIRAQVSETHTTRDKTSIER